MPLSVRGLSALFLIGTCLAIAFFGGHTGSNAESLSRFDEVRARVLPGLDKALNEKGLKRGAPVFVRIFKESDELEVWLQQADGTFALFKTYPICFWSGTLGPKVAEGDQQAPEGCYFVNRGRMNPQSRYHLSFDLGYPNAYDRHHQRTGSYLMVHGACVSIGCFAMTDAAIEEIYPLVHEALANGQRFVRVHSFPFRMTPARLARAAQLPDEAVWLDFWENLREGYDLFERDRIPPDAQVKDGRYIFKKTPAER